MAFGEGTLLGWITVKVIQKTALPGPLRRNKLSLTSEFLDLSMTVTWSPLLFLQGEAEHRTTMNY